MRIVGGMWRGRPFEAPEGRLTRPTTDRMRESIASMVLSAQGLDLSGCRVLDAFAGSGGVGLELLSRGALSCTFWERDRRAASLVRGNCKAMGAPPGAWRVVVGDAMRLSQAPEVAGGPFAVAFCDPPYALAAADVARMLRNLCERGQLEDGCLVVYERSAQGPALALDGARALRTRKHGGTCIDLLRMGGER